MPVSVKDPIIQEKLINHPDYIIPPALPHKPSNPNAWDTWEEECKLVLEHSTKHNAKLFKTIWNELNKEEDQ